MIPPWKEMLILLVNDHVFKQDLAQTNGADPAGPCDCVGPDVGRGVEAVRMLTILSLGWVHDAMLGQRAHQGKRVGLQLTSRFRGRHRLVHYAQKSGTKSWINKKTLQFLHNLSNRIESLLQELPRRKNSKEFEFKVRLFQIKNKS